MALFQKMREPVILKEDSQALVQLEQLRAFLPYVSAGRKEQLEQDILCIEYGIRGEEALLFELRNSHLPMYILHDLFFEKDGLTTQIDYLIITRKLVFVIECKNLYGTIEIDRQGNFTRTVQFGKRCRKEGVYSPVTQNQRHLDMLRELRRETRSPLFRLGFDSTFGRYYQSVIVLANPKSVLQMQYAPREIRNSVIRADGLIRYIRQMNDGSAVREMSDKAMRELADFFLEKNVSQSRDYTEKYRSSVLPAEPQPEVTPRTPVESLPVYQALKDYRSQKSYQERIKAYYIFNNLQLEALIQADPGTIEELRQISGFGDVKCEKYGADILRILREYRTK